MLNFLLILLGLLYFLSPYDLFPDFIVGWGWIDDLIILWFLWRFFKSSAPGGFSSEKYGHEKRRSFENGRESDSRIRENNTPKDPYTMLGIERNASPEEIKKAYKQLANKYHPDKVYHLGDDFKKLAEERFKEIQEAYQHLMDK
jgi:uncharacterized membrane protein YkvA (DUF1232 family)